MRKKLLSIILSLAMVLTLFSVMGSTVYAAGGRCGDNARWAIEGTTLVISGSGAMADYQNEKDQPWTLDGLSSMITKIEVESGIDKLGRKAFDRMTSVQEVSLPFGLKEIGEYAFCFVGSPSMVGAPAMTQIDIPDTVTKIGSGALQCLKITSLDLSVEEKYTGITEIPYSLCQGCSQMKSAVLPQHVEIIRNGAFYNCSSLETVSIPETCTEIGNQAFGNCDSLKTVKYYGSPESWNAISIGEDNDALLNAEIVYAKKDIDVNKVKWKYSAPLVYDGKVKTVGIINVPSNVEAALSGNKATNVGSYTAKAVFTANDSSYQITGKLKDLTWKIVPKKAVLESIKVSKKKMTVKMTTKPSSKGASTYQIYYKQKGTSTWKKATTTASYKTIKSLKKGKYYYVKVRAYKKVGTTTYYGAWSKTKLSKKIK